MTECHFCCQKRRAVSFPNTINAGGEQVVGGVTTKKEKYILNCLRGRAFGFRSGAETRSQR